MVRHFLSLAIVLVVSTVCTATAPCRGNESMRQPFKSDTELLQLLRGARDGDREAQFRAGVNYENGCGVAQDFSQAADWYRKAADNGHPAAQNSLGSLYVQGHGVAQSDEEAMKWFLRAASEGFAPAQNNVGYMYETGRVPTSASGSSSSGNEAVKWYRKAAQSGSARRPSSLPLSGARRDPVARRD